MAEFPFLRNRCLIGDRWIQASNGASFEVRNPATQLLIGTVPNLGQSETQAAIVAASEAFRGWSKTRAVERSRKLRSIADFLSRNIGELAKLLTAEQGKPILEAEREISYGASFFEWFAEEGRRAYGDIIPSPLDTHRISVLKEPVGVCAAITPWNFPSAMVARKMAAALAAGCTFICKPASETPFSALALGIAAEGAGIPPGVVNLITGDPEPIADALLGSPIVRKLSFTGSTEVGKLLMRKSADTLKRLTLELGGNAPFIVFEDADLDQAVKGALFAKYRNAGQTCVCVNRFFLHEKIAEKFTEMFAAASRKLHVGNGVDRDTDIGPLISVTARQKVSRLIQEAISQGAHLLLGGLPDPSGPYVFPTILTKVTPAMSICTEEIFAPVATIQTFSREIDVVQAANATSAGLVAYFYTSDLSRSARVSEALEFGMVGINTSTVSFAEAPFGGIKQSGFGREGSFYGLDEYLSLKYCATEIAGSPRGAA